VCYRVKFASSSCQLRTHGGDVTDFASAEPTATESRIRAAQMYRRVDGRRRRAVDVAAGPRRASIVDRSSATGRAQLIEIDRRLPTSLHASPPLHCPTTPANPIRRRRRVSSPRLSEEMHGRTQEYIRSEWRRPRRQQQQQPFFIRTSLHLPLSRPVRVSVRR